LEAFQVSSTWWNFKGKFNSQKSGNSRN
jgi:hypothetical protein